MYEVKSLQLDLRLRKLRQEGQPLHMSFDQDEDYAVGVSAGEVRNASVCSFVRAHAHAKALLSARTIRRCANRIARALPCADVVVAVPVRNEIERISSCFRSLASQGCSAQTVKVLFLVNSSEDGTAEWLFDNLESMPIAAEVIRVRMPSDERNAGRARWLANHAALDMVDPRDGMLFMTDADSCAPQDWVARYSSMLKQGWDAVAGAVDINEADRDQIVASLDHRNQLEGAYTALIDELESLIDPIAHDPWPRHFNASGANIAARVSAIRQLDDFPSVTCGEDRAFIKAIEAKDLRVRHDVATRVHTSGRLFGRAIGGMADTLRHRTHVPESPCDERLERADRAYLRASLRATWRRMHLEPNPTRAQIEQFANDLAVPLQTVVSAAAIGPFGASWDALQVASPRLARRSIVPAVLPHEIKRASNLLSAVRRGIRPSWREPDQEMRA